MNSPYVVYLNIPKHNNIVSVVVMSPSLSALRGRNLQQSL